MHRVENDFWDACPTLYVLVECEIAFRQIPSNSLKGIPKMLNKLISSAIAARQGGKAQKNDSLAAELIDLRSISALMCDCGSYQQSGC